MTTHKNSSRHRARNARHARNKKVRGQAYKNCILSAVDATHQGTNARVLPPNVRVEIEAVINIAVEKAFNVHEQEMSQPACSGQPARTLVPHSLLRRAVTQARDVVGPTLPLTTRLTPGTAQPNASPIGSPITLPNLAVVTAGPPLSGAGGLPTVGSKRACQMVPFNQAVPREQCHKPTSVQVLSDSERMAVDFVRVREGKRPVLRQTARQFGVGFISPLEIAHARKLQGGSFGRVSLAIWGGSSGDRVVVKVFHHPDPETHACRELAANRLARCCPFVHPVLGFTFDESGKPCLVYPYGGRTLLDASVHNKIQRGDRIRVCRELVRAVQSLHEHGVLHLDLKANNVLYDVANGKVRLIDLGLAQPIKGNKNPYINVPGRTLRTWHGSEYLNAQHFTTSTDIYALGWMFLDVLIPLESGFHKQPPSPHCMKVAALATSIETNVLACIRRNPTRRPTCATLLAAFDLDHVR